MRTDRARRAHGTVNKQGRVVIPAEVRAALALEAGDRVEFVVEDDGVRLVTARAAAMAVWANNTGGDAGDSTAKVRAARTEDQRLEEAGFNRSTPAPADLDLSAADLLAELGVA
ncbi:AbrB/MazE/SpoVT family DNA-binding domain-containing protein [Cellulomonas sp. S1-8]|uniref:AbrB/MazE/SpoVT family DNA-binding domain-containing protein n=1 Tax=Cellulomonas sp. S1-8 TaxID=2904790 RepID=UPI002243D82C|nr:AbrB/MazE/SpoVT family DNA-binding domain-containing protein [Cellulomonas sp. S1-8]UZN03529.1 AbrB/MazE/SpoVT family DNA-binding domain-containing protein [Cellulomonas sp. S1-8]